MRSTMSRSSDRLVRGVVLAWVVTLVAWTPAAAWAQEASVQDTGDKPWNEGVSLAQRQAARELFLEGNRLLDVPLFARAAEKYAEALVLWEHPAFHYNLAIAQLNLVQPIEAYESLQKAMQHGAGPLGEREHRQAQDYLERLAQQLGRIAVACDEAGAEVTLDGRLLFTGPGRYEGVVLPGGHQLVASKQGHIPEARQVVLSPGDDAEIALVLHVPDRIETERYLPAWAPWATMGASAALLSVGGYLDWHSSRALDTFDTKFDEHCRRGCTAMEVPELAGELRRAETEKRTALGLYVGGSLVLVGSAVLVYANRERVIRSKVRGDSISVIPVAGPHGAGIAAWGRF